MTDGYLSRDRGHLAAMQRQRRATNPRIDYYPSREALALIESRRTRYSPTNNNSGIIDTIIVEWATLAGIKYREIEKPKTPELFDTITRARTTSEKPELRHPLKAGVICGARRRRDGQPCQAMSVPGKERCKWHGGASTGPRTDIGRARSMANLRQYRSR